MKISSGGLQSAVLHDTITSPRTDHNAARILPGDLAEVEKKEKKSPHLSKPVLAGEKSTAGQGYHSGQPGRAAIPGRRSVDTYA